MQRNVGLVSSVLAEAEVEAEQACLRPTSYSGMPVIGALPGASGAFIATGTAPAVRGLCSFWKHVDIALRVNRSPI